VNLKRYLLIRMTLLGLLCWVAASVYVIASAGQRANAELAEHADLLALRMEIDIARQMTAVVAGHRFPELARVAAQFPDRLCIRYRAADGQSDEIGCDDEDDTRPEAPRWLLTVIAALSPAQPTLERNVRLWGAHAGIASFTPDPIRLHNAQWHSVRALLGLAAVTVLALDGLAVWVVGHALRPTGQIVAALDQLETSSTEVKLPAYEIREFRQIAQGVQRLAERLAKTAAARDLLTTKLIRLQEDERRELTHALHEEVGQCVTALAAHSTSLRFRLASAEALTVADLEPLDSTLEYTQQALRSLLLRLRPPAFEQQGLVSALRDLVTGWRARLRGQPQLALEADQAALDNIGGDQALCVYRIVQECLSNIARHASDGRSATVAVQRVEHGIETWISNDHGASAPCVAGSGLGLRLLAERVRALGGSFEVSASSGAFSVRARLPLAI